jgi:peptidylprolyl isomerase
VPAPPGQPFTATGAYGKEPTILFPAGNPPTGLVKAVTKQGTGPVVQKGEVLVAHYVGQVWNGAVFDSSYKRNALASFTIGTGAVIPGWDEALVGVKAGSRVLLSVPPAKGYGTAGNSQAGIKGTDTIVFVVDVVASYNAKLAAPTDAVAQNASVTGITVTGKLGAEPKVSVAKGTPEPTKPSATILDKGNGPATAAGLAMVQFNAVDWTNAPAGDTWTQNGLTGLPIGAGGPLDSIKGIPIGSRVLVLLPKDTSSTTGHPSIAIVLDIVAEPAPPA